MTRELKILKGVLLLRKTTRVHTKEQQMAHARKYYSDELLDTWIESLKNKKDVPVTEIEYDSPPAHELNFLKRFDPEGYSASCPWNAPGMNIRDFI